MGERAAAAREQLPPTFRQAFPSAFNEVLDGLHDLIPESQDQNRSSRCSSPWYSRNSIALPSFIRQTCTSGNDAEIPFRCALTVARTTTRSSSASTLSTSMLNAPPDSSIVRRKKLP